MDTPMRFKKEIMRAATTKDHSDRISLDAMKRVLTNIGAEDRLSTADWKVIFKELGNETGEIPTQRMEQII
jgi:Ca2+-binding EF-hand superfamily protein